MLVFFFYLQEKKDKEKTSFDDSAFEALEKDFQEVIIIIVK